MNLAKVKRGEEELTRRRDSRQTHRAGLLRRATGVQDPQDGLDGAPASRRDQGAEELVELAKVSNRLHVASMLADREASGQRRHAHEPVAGRWDRERKSRLSTTTRCQEADEPDPVRRRWRLADRDRRRKSEQVPTFTADEAHRVGYSRAQLVPKVWQRAGPADDECAGCANVDDVERSQLPGEKFRTQRTVAADIDPSEQDDESHGSSEGKTESNEAEGQELPLHARGILTS